MHPSRRSGVVKIGTLAKKTGLTIRTLRYYEEVGLLAPAQRTDAGHRLYGVDEVIRLQKVVLLRQHGFSLEEIHACLDHPDYSLYRVIELHLVRLKQQIDVQQQIYRRLETIATHLQAEQEISVEAFMQTIEVITMYEKYYTQEQLNQLEQRGRQLGEQQIREGEAAWKELLGEFRAEMEKGTDPASETVQRLAEKQRDLVQAFTGGDPGIANSLKTMYEQEGPTKASRGMIDPEVGAYMAKAMEATQKPQ